jgi:hypothetical protein
MFGKTRASNPQTYSTLLQTAKEFSMVQTLNNPPTPGTPSQNLLRVPTEKDIRAGRPVESAEPLIVLPSGPTPRTAPLQLSFREPVADFINTYADWADVVELPREAHEAVAIQLIASLLNRNGVFMQNGKYKFSMDVCIALLSDSGAGRSTSLEAIDQVFNAADQEILDFAKKAGWDDGMTARVLLKTVCKDSRWGSPQAMFQDFAVNPHGLMMWGEMSEKFAMLNSGPFKQYGAKQWITDKYDIQKPPDAVTYRVAGKSSDTPPIVFPTAPRLNILAGSSKDWFYNFLTSDDSGGGWLPRWILIHLPPKSRTVPRPIDVAPELIAPMARWLQDVSVLAVGEATMPEEVWKLYEAWYRATEHRFESHPNRALAVPYWNRHKGHVLKLAVIYTVSMGDGLVVTAAAWERAVAKAAELEKSIYKILENGATAAGYALKRYEDRIRAAGPEALLRSEFTRAFQHDPRRDREDRLNTLLESRAVHTWLSKTPGRPGQMYVVADLCGGRCDGCSTAASAPALVVTDAELEKKRLEYWARHGKTPPPRDEG